MHPDVQHRTRRVLRGSVRIPTSKPGTQRALLMGTLATGTTVIHRPNVCSESLLLRQACTELGARIRWEPGLDRITIEGTGGRLKRPATILRTAGSGFALRHLMALTSFVPGPCVLTGDRRLAQRPVKPLADALTALGSRLEPADPALGLPLVNWEYGLTGGEVRVAADETSQFVSAILLATPYADGPVTVRVPEPIVGASYIRMTMAMMRTFGARVSGEVGLIKVEPGGYQGVELVAGPDATSLFYFTAAAVVADADYLVRDVTLGEQPLLDAAVAAGRALGVRIIQQGPDIRIVSGPAPVERVEIDATNIPTFVPALAAVASSLPCGLRVTGASHIRHHKTSRLSVMMDQLARLGRPLAPVVRDGELDGFESLPPVSAHPAPTLDSCGDHRNFMALYLASLAGPRPVSITGSETVQDSFSQFLDCFKELQATST